MSSSTTVFVSGATGYIAKQTIKDLLSRGYKVIGSVRSAEKGETLKKVLNSDNFSYEVVAILEEEGNFDDALKKHPEVTVFLHTASPVHFQIEDVEREMLRPAVYGTKFALKSIKEHAPQIKRVVVTSSYAAMASFEQGNGPSNVVDENSWNNTTWEESLKSPTSGYFGSKTFAEKAAWDFVETEKPNFELSVVAPVFVFGPQAFDEDVKDKLNASAEIINSFLKLKPDDQIPNVKGLFIDVRDISKAHILAFEKDEAKNERLFLVSVGFTAQLILDIIRKRFPELTSALPLGEPGSYGDLVDIAKGFDNEKTKKILDFKFIGLEDSVYDSIKQILNARK